MIWGALPAGKLPLTILSLVTFSAGPPSDEVPEHVHPEDDGQDEAKPTDADSAG